eukprot:1147514-Pelagomonas_calceolata.AAC.2
MSLTCLWHTAAPVSVLFQWSKLHKGMFVSTDFKLGCESHHTQTGCRDAGRLGDDVTHKPMKDIAMAF